MEEIRKLCEECVNKNLYQIIISKARKAEGISKVKIRPILLKEQLMYQVSETRGNQIFHLNLSKQEVIEKMIGYLRNDLQQAQIDTLEQQVSILISKKGKINVKRKLAKQQIQADLKHNKVKRYILAEGEPIPFLMDLGIQTMDGRIIRSRYDKFRQINRYLEFVADILPILPKERKVEIVDFGCGKSYLTFALYYFIRELCKREVHIIGLDLKEKVIEDCNRLAEGYGYEGLHFLHGDVAGYQPESEIDMVVTLHACDTATDYALEKAVKWGAKVIFTVPCCQHEVNTQIQNDMLQPIFKYGLLKERIAALITDGIRANLLEEEGYQVQVMEFIDMEHTPKNILIRAVKQKEGRKKETNIRMTADSLGLETTLQKLFCTEEKEWSRK